MEEGFGAENLEDGELWLPPDFFSMDEVQTSTKFEPPLQYCSATNPRCLEDLTQRFSAFTVLERYPHDRSLVKPLPTLQRFKPAVCYGFTGGVGCSLHNFYDCVTGSNLAGHSAVNQSRLLNSVQTEVGTFVAERAYALQMEPRTRFTLNRVWPGVGTYAHGGTGVFLPRISSNMSTATVTKNHRQHCVRKGHGMINKHEIQLPPRKILLKRMQGEFQGCVTTGVRLPNDWTY